MAKRLRGTQLVHGTVRPLMGFKFSRAPGACLALALLLPVTLAGCATAPRPAALAGPPLAAESHRERDEGTVTVVRAIAPRGETAAGPRAEILAAMGLPATDTAAPVATAEIIVRTDRGETLSVVQSGAGLEAGERVLIVPTNPLRLRPLAGAAPARE